MFDAIFSGPPAGVPSPGGATVTSGIDTANGTEYVNVGAGWKPLTASVAKASLLAQVADVANLLTYKVPVTGLYRIDAYEISTVATSGTLPAVNAASTEGDTSGSITTAVLADKTGVAAANTVNAGNQVVFAKAGTNIVLSTASYATLTYNIKTRISFLG
jgi:hypothetical protein